jgi:hypothetical protein
LTPTARKSRTRYIAIPSPSGRKHGLSHLLIRELYGFDKIGGASATLCRLCRKS